MLGTLGGRTDENSQAWGMGHLPSPPFVPALSGPPGWSAHPPGPFSQPLLRLSLPSAWNVLFPFSTLLSSSPEGSALRLLLREALPWLLFGGVIISPVHIPTWCWC